MTTIGHDAHVADEIPVQVQRAPAHEQILAILGPDIFKWAVKFLPAGVAIDDVRHSDLISVTEADVLAHVAAHGFDDRVVVEGTTVDDRICVVAGGDVWRVFHTERGNVFDESVFPSKDAARAEVVRRQMLQSRTLLNHRYWHAHGLEFPCADE